MRAHVFAHISALFLLATTAFAEEKPSPEMTRAEAVEKIFGMSEEKFDKIAEFADFYATRIIYPKIQPTIDAMKKKIRHDAVHRESIEESVAKLFEEPLAHWVPYIIRSSLTSNVDVTATEDLQHARKDPRVEKLLRIFSDGSKEDYERLRIATLDAINRLLYELGDEEVRKLCTGRGYNISSAVVLPEILRRFPPEMDNLKLLLQMHDHLKGKGFYCRPMPEITVHAIKYTLPYLETYSREMEKLNGPDRLRLEAYLAGSKNAVEYASICELGLDDDIIEKDPQRALQLYRIYQAASTSWQSEDALIAQTLAFARRVCGMDAE